MRVIERSYQDPEDPGRIVEDGTVRVADEGPVPPSGDVLLSLARLEQGDIGPRSGRTGVVAPGDTEPERLAAVAERVDEIALELPKFTDGRAYSTARLLRERFGWDGPLRAVGHVLHDQLFYLSRCGFDRFELSSGKDVDGALAAFKSFSVRYQAAADEPRPHFRRSRVGAGK